MSKRQKVVAVLAALFLVLAVLVSVFFDALIFPVWLALLAHVKVLFKFLTPDRILLFVKNSFIVQSKKKVIDTATSVVIISHSPWRRRIKEVKMYVLESLMAVVAGYRALPVLAQVAIALVILIVSAGSSYAFIALLIIPAPVMAWLKKQIVAVANKTGVAKLLAGTWSKAVPSSIRGRVQLYFKWTVGRLKVRLSRRVHALAKQARLKRPV